MTSVYRKKRRERERLLNGTRKCLQCLQNQQREPGSRKVEVIDRAWRKRPPRLISEPAFLPK